MINWTRVFWHMLLRHDVSVPEGDTAKFRRAIADDWPADWVIYYCRSCKKGWGRPDKKVLPFSPFVIVIVLGMIALAEVVKR